MTIMIMILMNCLGKLFQKVAWTLRWVEFSLKKESKKTSQDSHSSYKFLRKEKMKHSIFFIILISLTDRGIIIFLSLILSHFVHYIRNVHLPSINLIFAL